MYSEILIDEVFTGYKMKDGIEMKNLSRINILIGKNNSGKSRFLRRIFSSNRLLFESNKEEVAQIIQEVIGLKAQTKTFLNSWDVDNFKVELQKVAAIDVPRHISKSFDFSDIHAKASALKTAYNHPSYSTLTPTIRNALASTNENLISLIEELPNSISNFERIYLPTLRGLRPLQIEDEKFNGITDNYLTRTKADYFLGEEIKNSRIITGLHLYDETRRLLLGNLKERDKVRDFETFISKNFFDGTPFSIIPKIDDDVVYVRIGPDVKDEKPIHALGDGIQAIIILTYPLFFHEGEHAVLCFEEPETHLHPGLQRLFIEILRLTRFESFQYFITTHSNHFLDLTADYNDISVYTFSKKEDEPEETFMIENVENSDGNVLQLIGARASSVFLSNCTIWVEGITDRLYLRKYLEVYQESKSKRFKEDYHYSFVEYGGNNITHWSFLDADDPKHPPITVERLCAKLFLITDKDGAGLTLTGAENMKAGKKHQRHIQLKQKLNDRYYCLNCREIENLLKKEIIKATIIKKEEANTALDFRLFDKAGHVNEKIGSFIEKKVTGKKKKYEAKSGTIHDKLGFCKIAVEEIKSMADLSDEAQALVKKLYEFIKQNNQ